ncbi:conserved hypothetical protein [Neospora caninum Liverpool]|uniref:Transmembrane protein n=1 Tax=Neospora caninum (strain Liverpool) TaxID=572307 RepID=F0VJB7_NEOCL|nr:conserved hypothetical protein [Neospora caninum Liverpool]CBZ53828.1 conserved hypothetical protein [Neospora caninum Liverpool]CEL67822.1 TPA: hypothetical protein BN1204_036090 [Neospora caninum Liverpool]|eukprot:XP_003883860.1 conserved hypothetical protein [Neospora caninum Liverpool]
MSGSNGDESSADCALTPTRRSSRKEASLEMGKRDKASRRERKMVSLRQASSRRDARPHVSGSVLVLFVCEAVCFFCLGSIFCYFFWSERFAGSASRESLSSHQEAGARPSPASPAESPEATHPASSLAASSAERRHRRHSESGELGARDLASSVDAEFPFDFSDFSLGAPPIPVHADSPPPSLFRPLRLPGQAARRLNTEGSILRGSFDTSRADESVTEVRSRRKRKGPDGAPGGRAPANRHSEPSWVTSTVAWTDGSQKELSAEEYELSTEMWGHQSERSNDDDGDDDDEDHDDPSTVTIAPHAIFDASFGGNRGLQSNYEANSLPHGAETGHGSTPGEPQIAASGPTTEPSSSDRAESAGTRNQAGAKDGSERGDSGNFTATRGSDSDRDEDGGAAPKRSRSRSRDRRKRDEDSGTHAANDGYAAGQGVMHRMWVTRQNLAKIAKKKLRQFHCDMPREQVCDYLKSDQQQYRVWFTLAVLYGLEWPFYSYADGGGTHFLQELLEQTRDFGPPAGASSLVRKRYEQFRECGMPQAFETGLNKLMECLPSGAEFPNVLKKAAENLRFRKVLFGMGDVHVPFDGITSLAHVFDTVEDAMGLVWGKDVFLGKDPSAPAHCKPFTSDELYYKYMFAFSESRRYFSMVVLLNRAMRQHVTQKPHNGIILLLVEQPHVSSSSSATSAVASSASTAVLGSSKSNNPRRLSAVSSSSGSAPRSSRGGSGGRRIPELGADSDPDYFQRLQDFQMLQERVRQSVLMKLESAIVRFYPTSKTMRKDIVKLPDVRVSGFFARSAEGRTHEKGLVGLEIDFKLMERFKEQTPPNSVLIQVTLLDLWATQPIEEWPDVMDPSKKLVSSYTATQLLKSELQWDQSLASFEWGRTKFIYSTVSEVFEYEKIDTANRVSFDPDIQVMLLQSYSDFVANGKEDGMLAMIIEVLQRKPLGHSGVPREFRADRIVLQGTATPLEQHGGGKGQLYRKMQFGSGIDYGEVLQIEKAIREHTVMLHLKIVGLGHAAAEDWRGLKAHEILNRLAQRLRGTFEIHYVYPGKMPDSPQVASRSVKCTNVIPDWILALAVFATASFFIIFIILMMYHRKLDVPWWVSCWCSRFSPWEKDAADKQSTCPSDMESSRGDGEVGPRRQSCLTDDEECEDPRTAHSMTRIIEEDYDWADYGHAGDISRANTPTPRSGAFEHVSDSSVRSTFRVAYKCGSSSGVYGLAGGHRHSSSCGSLGSARIPSRGYDDVNMGHPVAPPGVLNSMPVVRTPTLTRAVSRRLGAESGFT